MNYRKILQSFPCEATAGAKNSIPAWSMHKFLPFTSPEHPVQLCVANKSAGMLCFYDYAPLFGAVKDNNHIKHFRTFRMRQQCEVK